MTAGKSRDGRVSTLAEALPILCPHIALPKVETVALAEFRARLTFSLRR
jgi:hypothetical protein